MPTAEAHIQTGQPSRYLVQLCRHAEGMKRHADKFHHRGRRSQVDRSQAGPELLHVEWSDTSGVLRLNWGECALQTGPDTLTVRVEAADEKSLQRILDLIGGDFERFGRRDRLKVNWQKI
jgi:hypothetical protein